MIVFLLLILGINEEYLSLKIHSEKVEIGLLNPLKKPIEFPRAISGVIESNVSWVLFCRAESEFLSTRGAIIPIERLSFRVNGGEWVPFKMGEIKLLEGNPTSGESFSIDLRLDLKWEDPAGEYLSNLSFTLMKRE